MCDPTLTRERMPFAKVPLPGLSLIFEVMDIISEDKTGFSHIFAIMLNISDEKGRYAR